ncbi:hypothetical protein GALL_381140 [mine drainage metagenome]|uniref:Uncharacterized protein n=1 Tax=mine drainage metagenome TaxID=410659 RepID=A0A1J5Q9S9_9ZZZZ
MPGTRARLSEILAWSWPSWIFSASTTSIDTGRSKLFCSVRVAVTTTGEFSMMFAVSTSSGESRIEGSAAIAAEQAMHPARARCSFLRGGIENLRERVRQEINVVS